MSSIGKDISADVHQSETSQSVSSLSVPEAQQSMSLYFALCTKVLPLLFYFECLILEITIFECLFLHNPLKELIFCCYYSTEALSLSPNICYLQECIKGS